MFHSLQLGNYLNGSIIADKKIKVTMARPSFWSQNAEELPLDMTSGKGNVRKETSPPSFLFAC